MSIKKRILAALDERGVWGWFENITKADGKGELPLHARLFVHAGHERHAARVEYRIGWQPSAHASVSCDPFESELCAGVSLPWFALYGRVGSYSLLGKITSKIGHRVARLSVHDGTIWWETPLADPDVAKSDEPWYVRGSFDVVRALLGDEQHTETVIAKDVPVEIPMPEGTYAGTCTIKRVRMKRSRWFGKTAKIATIDIPGGVPIPGKGESPHDLDEDAVLRFSMAASSPADAVGALVGSVLVTRWKRAGANWRPEKGAPRAEDVPTDCSPVSA